MAGSAYYLRLAASLCVAAGLGALIAHPGAPKELTARAGAQLPEPAIMAERACEVGAPPLRVGFAPIEDVISISPLGGVTAPGEPLPAPDIRINTRQGATIFERRETNVIAPARADIVAIERRIRRNDAGEATGQSWTLHFRLCKTVGLYYADLDGVSEEIVRRAGGLSAFTEIRGPDHSATQTRIRVREGDVVGRANGFDVGLLDYGTQPADLVRPDRYLADPYVEARVRGVSPALISALETDVSRARCALDYLPARVADQWRALLGDAYGLRRAKGEEACRAAILDTHGAAQGAWFTDASNNAVASKVSAVALAPDAVDPERLIFALHGRLKSLTPDLVALAPMQHEQRKEAAKSFLTFEKGEGLINRPFDAVVPGGVYCYQNLRAAFVGPRINGVILLALESNDTGATVMRIEARGETTDCLDLPQPWRFSGSETTFYR